MKGLKNLLTLFSFLVFLIIAQITAAEPMDGKINLDKFFRYEINIKNLILDKDNQAINLMAQMKDPEAFTDNVNNFDQYVALGNLDFMSMGFTYVTEFDKNQKISDRALYGGSWVGVLPYKQENIPKLSFQAGFKAVKQCMIKKGSVLPDKIARFILFKLNVPPNYQFTYDYIFHEDEAPLNQCQEVLYFPETGSCSYGMKVNCHFETKDLVRKVPEQIK